jgi:hypothetical protein
MTFLIFGITRLIRYSIPNLASFLLNKNRKNSKADRFKVYLSVHSQATPSALQSLCARASVDHSADAIHDSLAQLQQSQLDAAAGIDQYGGQNHQISLPPVSSSFNPLMGITAHGSHTAQLLAAGFGSFSNTSAQFIPFNLMGSGVNSASSCRISSPTTTIFDLDQQPQASIQRNVSQMLNKNEVLLENSLVKPSNNSPQLVDMGNCLNVENSGNSEDLLPNAIIHAMSGRKEHKGK